MVILIETMTNVWCNNISRSLTAKLLVGLGMLAWLAGTALPSFAAPSANVGVRTYILNPPNPITGFAAAGVGINNGDIQLAWIAPRNVNGVSIDFYQIRFATFAALNVGQAEAWWSNAAATQFTFTPAANPGVQEFTIRGGFTLGTRYYFGIKSVDTDAQVSLIDDRVGTGSQANALPLVASSGPPTTPLNFVGVAVSTFGIQWSWNSVLDAGFYTLNQFPSGVMVVQTTNTTTTELNFTANTVVTRTVSAGNGFGLSPASPAQSVYTLAAVPASLLIGNVGFTDITLNWNANGNSNGTQYRLERSLDGTNFLPLTTVTITTHTDSGLAELTTYYYRVRATNGDGINTTYSNIVSTRTPLQVDFLAPHKPMGLKGVLDPSGRAFTLIWDSVTTNSDNTSMSDLSGYHVYRRTSLYGSGTRITSTPLSVTAFADQVDGQTFYYTLTAIDNSGNESLHSLTADSSANANIIYLAPDNLSSVVMPQTVNNLLRSGFNSLGVGLDVYLTEKTVPPNTNVVRYISFNLVRGDTEEIVTDLAFQLPNTAVAVGYNLVNGQVVTGDPTASNSLSAKALNATPKDLAFYWFNGVTWVKVGGTLDEAAQVLRTKTSYLGDYQIRVAAQATSLTLSEGNVYPRVFTPNGDGLNDRVYFILENPNDTQVVGEILDLHGRMIKTLNPPASGVGIGTTLSWDGTDMNGALVPSGAYVYRIKGEGKTITGTIAVAR